MGGHDGEMRDDDLEMFERHRPLLFAVAYRMLGSVMDAEDIVQEAYLRWQRREEAEVQSPKAYLSAIVTRLCIDHLRLARVQREEYVGPWMPEPLIADERDVDADPAVLAESLSLAFLALLERLGPVERAVFLLHDVFGYAYDEIAAIVGRSAANCRQIAHRAREHVHASRPRFAPDPEQKERLARRFVDAMENEDVDALVAMLAADAALFADGGGKATAARRPVEGAERVARFLASIAAKPPPGLSVRIAPVNGEPAVVCSVGSRPISVFALEVADGRIRAIRVMVNPDKLHGLEPALEPDDWPSAHSQPP